MATPELIIVGRLRKAHGIRGDLVVEPITDAPAEVFSVGRRLFAGTATGEQARDRAELVVMAAKPFQGGSLIVHFDAIPDRTAAELWRDRYLLAPLDELAPPGEGEVYVHDLIGMHVALDTGEEVGEVLEVYELPQGLALDVRWGEQTVVLPFREPFLQSVDSEARRIVMQLPEGLLE